MARRGLLIGRFQPLHNGHLHMIKEILEEVDELIIVIGSAQYSHTVEDPFTAGERIQMIREALNGARISSSRYLLIPITDLNDNRLWVSHVRSLVPSFEAIYSNNPLVKMLFSEAGYKVRTIKFYQRDTYSATEIRRMIIENEDGWKKLVPKEVSDVIEEIKGEERLRVISSTDQMQHKNFGSRGT